MSRFGCFGRAEQKILRTDFLQWKFFFQKVTPSQLSASFVLFPAEFEYVFCQVKQPVKCLMEKNSDFYLCYHNSYEIWHSFSRTSMRNFLWCYYRWFITSLALKNVKNNAILFKLSWYKAFVHWKFKLLIFLMDSISSIFTSFFCFYLETYGKHSIQRKF